MTRNDKKLFIKETQSQIIQTYRRVFEDEMNQYLEINAMQTKSDMEKILKKHVVDMLF